MSALDKIVCLVIGFVCIQVNTYTQSYQVIKDSVGYNANFRGLSAVNNKVAWACGSNGTVARTIDGGLSWTFTKVLDSTKTELRDIQAWDELNAIVLSVKDPAEILKTSDGGKTWKEVYKATSHDIFLNGFDFWDKNKGIAYGDPVHGHFVILLTNDGGDTWQEHVKEHSPKATKDEAGFAASGTGITVGKKGKAWFGTGGNASHVFISEDFGKTWRHHETHVMHGMSSKGINSVLFMDDLNGVVVGGDFTTPDIREKTYSVTSDGGTTWHIPEKATHPSGYRSCVEMVTKNVLIAVGRNGIDISYDGGHNWEPVSQEGFLTIDRAEKGTTLFVAGNHVLGRLVPIK